MKRSGGKQTKNFHKSGNHRQNRQFETKQNRSSFSYDNNRSEFPHQKKRKIEKSEFSDVKSPSRRKPEIHTDECDSYFKSALETLKQGISDDQRGMFIQNVLEQTKGQELQLACQSVGSRLIEILLEESNDLSVILRFMQELTKNKEDSCGNCFASHVTENLLYYGLCHLQNWSADIEPENQTEDSQKKASQLMDVMSWIHALGEFCLANLQSCLEDGYGCHVLKTLIQVLGGHYMGQSGINQSKNSQKHKRQFEEEYLGSNYVSKEKKVIDLNEVPKFFVDILKKLSRGFLALENLKVYAVEGHSSPVFQSHLLVLKKRLPKHSRKFNKALISTLFKDQNGDGIPLALSHKKCSYLVERLFECSVEDQQQNLWNNHFCSCLEQLVVHPVGNFVLQRLFDVVNTKDLFETMCASVLQLFPTIFSARHFGIFASVSSACKRLGTQQAQFMKSLMQCLQCGEPEDRQGALIPLLLGFQTYDEYAQNNTYPEGNIRITLQGSLVAQSILKFDKPIKCVRSILEMKPDVVKYLACHVQGCHVLKSFLESTTVGGKSKDKFLSLVKCILVPLATDRNGSLTLSRMWVLLSMKQRAALAQEIAHKEKILNDSPSGSLIIKKFRIYHFKNRRQEWEKFQENLTKSRTDE